MEADSTPHQPIFLGAPFPPMTWNSTAVIQPNPVGKY